jgi:F-type H+-transporting ATPase subunit b
MITFQRSFSVLLTAFLTAAICSPLAAQEDDATAVAEISQESDTAMEDAAGEGHADAGHEDAEHHDSDPNHANVSDATYRIVPGSPGEFRTDMALFSAVVFVLLLLGLSATAWKPIMQGLEKRERMISDNIARAEKAASDATSKLAEYETKLAAAAEESQRLVAEARKDAEAAGQKLLLAAQEEAASQRDRAVADIEAAKRVALTELANQSTEVAMSLAQRVVGREVRAEDHQGLIQEMLSKLPSQN